MADLRDALRAAAVHELEWSPELADQLADIAIRRWRSYDRRSKPNKRSIDLRTKDLLQGLRQASPVDLIYVEPGDYERLAARFAEVLMPEN